MVYNKQENRKGKTGRQENIIIDIGRIWYDSDDSEENEKEEEEEQKQEKKDTKQLNFSCKMSRRHE